MKGTLYIVDALNYLFRAFHALPPLRTSAGKPTGAIYGLAQMLLRIEREQRPSHLCVVFDAPGKTFRDDLFPAYKAQRPPMPPELVEQISQVPAVVEAFGISTLEVPGVEADDVIATLVKHAEALGVEAFICSSDKDLMQLVRPGVSVLDTMKNRVLGAAEVEEKWGVPPSQVGDLLALMGDSVDNVPGVPGIGPKTAAELVRTFGSLDALLARADEVKGKRGEALRASADAVRLSRQLVTLKEDVPLPRSLDALSRVPPDREKLVALFRRFEFGRLLAEVQAAAASSAATPPAAPPAAPTPEQATLDFSPPAPATSTSLTIVTDPAALSAFAATLAAQPACGLAALLTEIDPMRADIVGLAFAFPDGTRTYVPFASRSLASAAALPEASILAALAPALAAPTPRKHLHDAKALAVTLGVRGRVLTGITSDSLLAAYLLDTDRTRHDLETLAAADGLPPPAGRSAWLGTGRTARAPADLPHAEVGAHLASEAATALALAPVQRRKLAAASLEPLYDDIELPLLGVLARIEARGVRLDVGYLAALGQEVARQAADLEKEIHALAGTPFNIGSPKQLQEILFAQLHLPIIRKTKTGASTDADVLEELAALHPVPAKIVEWRALTKLKGTYIDALPALVNPRTGRLHTTFHQAVAATGRLSSSDPNLQNIPIRSEVGRRIRQAFTASPGTAIVSADYSQIELRILAHFSEDPAFVDAFRSGQDIHQRTAAEVFGVALAAVTPEQRRIAKAINFGLVFGQTDFGLSQALRIPRADAKRYIESYFARYAGVKAYMERSIAQAREKGEVTTLLGRRRALPDIRASRAQDRAYAERIARNTPIQGTAADLLKIAMIRVDAGLSQRNDARLLLTVHDELVFEVDESAVPAFTTWVKAEMEAVRSLIVPLVVDVGSGPTWGDAH